MSHSHRTSIPCGKAGYEKLHSYYLIYRVCIIIVFISLQSSEKYNGLLSISLDRIIEIYSAGYHQSICFISVSLDLDLFGKYAKMLLPNSANASFGDLWAILDCTIYNFIWPLACGTRLELTGLKIFTFQ